MVKYDSVFENSYLKKTTRSLPPLLVLVSSKAVVAANATAKAWKQDQKLVNGSQGEAYLKLLLCSLVPTPWSGLEITISTFFGGNHAKLFFPFATVWKNMSEQFHKKWKNLMPTPYTPFCSLGPLFFLPIGCASWPKVRTGRSMANPPFQAIFIWPDADEEGRERRGNGLNAAPHTEEECLKN